MPCSGIESYYCTSVKRAKNVFLLRVWVCWQHQQRQQHIIKKLGDNFCYVFFSILIQRRCLCSSNVETFSSSSYAGEALRKGGKKHGYWLKKAPIDKPPLNFHIFYDKFSIKRTESLTNALLASLRLNFSLVLLHGD